jgi:hypothetical protein
VYNDSPYPGGSQREEGMSYFHPDTSTSLGQAHNPLPSRERIVGKDNVCNSIQNYAEYYMIL